MIEKNVSPSVVEVLKYQQTNASLNSSVFANAVIAFTKSGVTAVLIHIHELKPQGDDAGNSVILEIAIRKRSESLPLCTCTD